MKHITILLLIFSYSTATPSAITFKLNKGRLGDNILNFCKHQWVAYKNNLTLLVPDFQFKESLPLAKLRTSIKNINPTYFKNTIYIKSDMQINKNISQCLYIGNFYLHINGVNDPFQWTNLIFKLSIEDPTFGNLLKKMLTPDCTYTLPYKEITSVALHIRKGGGFDRPLASAQYKGSKNLISYNRKLSADQIHPLKFPPEQYYIEQLKMLQRHLNKKLYVYIFTDDKHPEEIAARIKKHFQNTDIIFDYRTSENSHDQNILLDVFMMSQFDYLIRSGSHFPWVSQIIGNHKGIIYPKKYLWKGNYLQVTHASFIHPDRKNKKITEQIIAYN